MPLKEISLENCSKEIKDSSFDEMRSHYRMESALSVDGLRDKFNRKLLSRLDNKTYLKTYI